MVSFPTSLDAFSNPSAVTALNNGTTPHATQHSNANDAIEALEAKLGISASTPVANSVLAGTGAGTSAWTTTPTIGALTVSAGSLLLSDGVASITDTTTGALLTLVNNDAGNLGVRLQTVHGSVSPAAGDTVCSILAAGKNSVNSTINYGDFGVVIVDTTATSEDGEFFIKPTVAGALTTAMRVGTGVIVGAPTGGYKGTGSINVAADIYKNNSAYTNPDYVLEHWATGQIIKYADKDGAQGYAGLLPLSSIKSFVRDKWHLPRFDQQAGHGIFSGSDALLASVEEAYLYIFQLEERIAALEARLN